ncbi:MAG: DoxX-like family protein [Candidatus Limnocylindrales bacterium]
MAIYVETLIRATMDDLWARTQDPRLHERWDLRFTTIEGLAAAEGEETRRFRYSTRIGFGMAISGEGETVGRRDLPDGSRTSSLRFGSDDRRSLIRVGSGYWKYVPTADGIRFLTGYDYRTRFGPVGAVIDRIAFRPLIGWATAWSFDRLRLWLEAGIEPRSSMRTAIVHGLARSLLAAVYLYQGLVPKVLGQNEDELSVLRAAGAAIPDARTALLALGLAEIALAVVLLARWHDRRPVLAAAAFAVFGAIVVAAISPAQIGRAFDPIGLGLGVLGLAAIDLLTLDGLPSAGRCLRRPATVGTDR